MRAHAMVTPSHTEDEPILGRQAAWIDMVRSWPETAGQGSWLTLVAVVLLLGGGCALKFNAPPDSCGDGVVDESEECDDGNGQDGDGCSRSCHVEDGWDCSEENQLICRPICGDGRLVGEEDCDGDDTDGQTCASLGLGAGQLGCLPSCRFDITRCEQQPECGNGIREVGEECDDGNNQDEDGCDGGCRQEAGWSCQDEPSVCNTVCGDGLCLTAGGEGVSSCAVDCSATAISAGKYHSCAVLADGTAWCWGSNGAGQLGTGATTGTTTPAAVTDLDGRVVAISAGIYHTCALLADGTVWCWGDNGSGQLGDGTTIRRPTPVQVSGITNAVIVSAGQHHSCAVLADGTAWCWGSSQDGQLGNGTMSTTPNPVQVSGITNAVAISTGRYHSCAMLTDGTVWCWGANGSGQLGDGTTTNSETPVQVSEITNAIAMSLGEAHTCVVLADKSAWCWGSNFHGQIGDGTMISRSNPVPVLDVTDAMATSTGASHTCSVLTDGTAWCWGYNAYGQLGDGTLTSTAIPVQVQNLTGALTIAAGSRHTCAVLADGRARCWGYNRDGRLGDGTTTNRDSPAPVRLP